jgi:transcriptional regulator with XRE-family HTH domain
MDRSNDFGKYLKALRKAKKINLSKLSRDSIVNRQHLHHIESGTAPAPMPDTIRKLSEALGCTHIGMMIKAGHVTEQEVFGYIHQKEGGCCYEPIRNA